MNGARGIFILLLCMSVVSPHSAHAMQSGSSSVDDCLTEARTHAENDFRKYRSAEAARLQLEVDAAACFEPEAPPAKVHLVGTVNADRARFARDFVVGRLTLTAYRAARADRNRKLAALLADPRAQEALMKGDADGDLVPDDRDRCANTPAGVPTDDRGCPVTVQPGPNDQADERGLRATLSRSRTLMSKSCSEAPEPGLSMPFEWGRGRQTKLGTMGFNVAVAKVGPQPAGCEVFYEIQFRFIDPNPGNPALPKSKIVTIVFSASEDLLADPARAVFGLPVAPAPLSPARAEVREAFLRQYFRASWRVRAVNGANLTSPWSPYVTQGPAGGGVDG